MPYTHTEIVHVDALHPEAASIERAATILRTGGLVAFPTETVYGLGADALQPEAVEGIFAAKGRPYSDPLIVHIADEHALAMFTSDIPPQARQLAQAFWPGPLTLILPASSHVPKLVTAGQPTVAVRMPRHPVALALLRALGSPIAAPSANRFMHVSPTTAQHVHHDLNGRISLILDGGACEIGLESTILDLCCSPPTILRPGGVSLEALHIVLPEIQPVARTPAKSTVHQEDEGQRAPGQLLTHYAPTVPALLFEGTAEMMRAAMLAEVHLCRARGEQVGVLIADEDIETFQQSGAHIYSLGKTSEQIATRLFAGLRVLEESGVQVIFCRSFEQRGLGLAIRDRLLKATGGQICEAPHSSN